MDDVLRFWSPRRSVLVGLSGGLVVVLLSLLLADTVWDVPRMLITPAVFLVPATLGAYLSARRPLLEITRSEVRHREDFQLRFRTLRLEDVASIEWPGYDNIGLRLKSGRVSMVSVMPLTESDRVQALAAIRNAVGAARPAPSRDFSDPDE